MDTKNVTGEQIHNLLLHHLDSYNSRFNSYLVYMDTITNLLIEIRDELKKEK